MAPITTRIGIPVLDNAFGGVYLKRATLVSGRRKSGKFVIVTQFLAKTLLSGENAVIFTAKTPAEITEALDAKGVDSKQAVESGQLVICPYSSAEREGAGPYAPLPFPQALEELAKLVLDNSISYAIFDSVVPWTAIEPLERMPDHAEDFVKSLETLKLTSLLLLPNAASPAAQSLTDVLRELCPINIELESKRFGAEFVLRVTKFQGATEVPLPWEKSLNLVPGDGFVAPDDVKAQVAMELASEQFKSQQQRQHAQPHRFRALVRQGFTDFAAPAPRQAPGAKPGFSSIIDIPGFPSGAGMQASAQHAPAAQQNRAARQQGRPRPLIQPGAQSAFVFDTPQDAQPQATQAGKAAWRKKADPHPGGRPRTQFSNVIQ